MKDAQVEAENPSASPLHHAHHLQRRTAKHRGLWHFEEVKRSQIRVGADNISGQE